jgi:hypothetical protein
MCFGDTTEQTECAAELYKSLGEDSCDSHKGNWGDVGPRVSILCSTAGACPL